MPTATFSLPVLPTFLPLVFISLSATHSQLFPSSLLILALWTFFYVLARGERVGG